MIRHFLFAFALIQLHFLVSDAQNVLETGTTTVPANDFVYTPQEGGSGWNCVKYSVTLPGGVNSDIIAGVVTLAKFFKVFS